MTESYARTWALDAHKDQSYGPHSYRYHLEKVVDIVKDYSKNDSDLYAAAWLHDIVEDTKVKLADIRDELGSEIADIVYLVTDPEGENRKERKKKLYEQFYRYMDDNDAYYDYQQTTDVWKIIKGAALVKGADRIANHNECFSEGNTNKMHMYIKEFSHFMQCFGKHMPDNMWDKLFEQHQSMIAFFHEWR